MRLCLSAIAMLAWFAASSTNQAFAQSSIKAAPASLSFGATEVRSTSGAESLTITNTGSAPQSLFAEAESTANEFAVQETGCDSPTAVITLAPGESCTVSVDFSPIADGLQTGVVDVLGSGGKVLASIPISGTGFSSGVFAGSVTSTAGTKEIDIKGGQSATGIVNLATARRGSDCVPASIPVTVDMSAAVWVSENGVLVNVASVPNHLVVPAGQCTAEFTITTVKVTSPGQGRLRAHVADDPNGSLDSVSLALTVNP